MMKEGLIAFLHQEFSVRRRAWHAACEVAVPQVPPRAVLRLVRTAPALLTYSFDELVAAYSILRTAYNKDFVSSTQPIFQADLARMDLAALPAVQRAVAADRAAADLEIAPFNLARGEMLRGLLFDLSVSTTDAGGVARRPRRGRRGLVSQLQQSLQRELLDMLPMLLKGKGNARRLAGERSVAPGVLTLAAPVTESGQVLGGSLDCVVQARTRGPARRLLRVGRASAAGDAVRSAWGPLIRPARST